MKMKINIKHTVLAAGISVPTISYAHDGSDFVGGLSGLFHDFAHSMEWLFSGAAVYYTLGFAAVGFVAVMAILRLRASA